MQIGRFVGQYQASIPAASLLRNNVPKFPGFSISLRLKGSVERFLADLLSLNGAAAPRPITRLVVTVENFLKTFSGTL